MALASVRPTPVGTMTHAETVWSPRIATRADGRRFTWSAGASSCEREAKAVVRRRQRGRFEKRRRDRGRNGGSGELGRKGGEEGGAERDGGSATRARDGPVEDLGALPPCCGGGGGRRVERRGAAATCACAGGAWCAFSSTSSASSSAPSSTDWTCAHHRGGAARGEASTPSGCCSPKGCGRPPAACPQR